MPKTVLILLIFLIFIQCGSEQEEIIINRNDGAIQLEINLPGSIQNPSFSPDGRSIVFTNFRNGYNKPPSDLYIFNLETQELTLLMMDGNSNVNLPGTCWNTQNLIFFSSDRSPHDEIFSVAASGTAGEEVQTTKRQNQMAFEPTSSPDGKWIVFESHSIDKEDNGIITKFRSDRNSDYIHLTKPGEDCRQPNWSPAGDRILFQRKENDQWDIWIMNTDGSKKSKITNFKGNKTDAVFTPDGQSIIFSYENEDIQLADIYKVSVSGGTPVQLTHSDAYEGAPAISPDGTKLIFESSTGDPDESKGTALYLLYL